jgi:hypothetical protein
VEHSDGTSHGLRFGGADRRVKRPATKACAMCGWVRLAGTIYECSNPSCEREEAA